MNILQRRREPRAGKEIAAKPGIFVISLDFELFWGVRSKTVLADYASEIRQVRQIVPRLLELFQEYRIHATWATVGFLFFESREQLMRGLPEVIPAYRDVRLNPYPYLEHIGAGEADDPYHYAPSLIRMVRDTPGQEVASHSFSHYYCRAPGQDAATFRADIAAARQAGQQLGIEIQSLVIPYAEVNPDYMPVLTETGINAYRDHPPIWLYRKVSPFNRGRLWQALRRVDEFVSLSGPRDYQLDTTGAAPYSINASAFLRPSVPRILRGLRQRRIIRDMRHAARSGRVFHLWWHPHNFGKAPEAEFALLEDLLRHYRDFQREFGMLSLNMHEVALRHDGGTSGDK